MKKNHNTMLMQFNINLYFITLYRKYFLALIILLVLMIKMLVLLLKIGHIILLFYIITFFQHCVLHMVKNSVMKYIQVVSYEELTYISYIYKKLVYTDYKLG